MAPTRCERCLRAISDGELRFVARLRLCGEQGEVIAPADAAAASDELQRALEAASRLDERELMETVIEEFTFTLCGGCRAIMRADPAGAANARGPLGKVRQ